MLGTRCAPDEDIMGFCSVLQAEIDEFEQWEHACDMLGHGVAGDKGRSHSAEPALLPSMSSCVVHDGGSRGAGELHCQEQPQCTGEQRLM